MKSLKNLKTTFEKLFPKHFFDWHESSDGSRMTGICPMHEDRSPSLSLYIGDDGWANWHCFAEKIGGHMVEAVVSAQGCDRQAAYYWLVETGLAAADADMERKIARHQVICLFLDWANNLLVNSPQAGNLRQYFGERGVSRELFSKLPVGFYPGRLAVDEWMMENNVDENVVRETLLPPGKLNAAGYLAFFYRDGTGLFNFIKIRDVFYTTGNKRIYILGMARSGGLERFGYFSPIRNLYGEESILLMEGEFDVMSVISSLYREDGSSIEDFDLNEIAIASFGGGSNLSKAVTQLEKNETEVILWPDNDVPGVKFVEEILEKSPYAYVMSPEDYQAGEDPADYSKRRTWGYISQAIENMKLGFEFIADNFSRAHQKETAPAEKLRILHAAVDFGKKLRPVDFDKYAEILSRGLGIAKEVLIQEFTAARSENGKFKISKSAADFGTYKKIIDKAGLEYWEKVSPVVLALLPDVILKDGLREERKIRFFAQVAGKNRSLVTIDADAFTVDQKFNSSIVAVLGAQACTQTKKIGDLRQALISLSESSLKTEYVQQYTGWSEDFTKFFVANGVVDREGFRDFSDERVELGCNPNYLCRYVLQRFPDDISAVRESIINDLLKVFPYKITLPFLAYIFSAPLYGIMPNIKPSVLFLSGITGSYKTSFSQVMMSFFGNFVGAGFESFNSTANAITKAGFMLKDVPFVVDDYKQIAVNTKQVVALIQGTGDRQGRARMNMDTSLRGQYYVRGNLICTGEDYPALGEASVLARMLLLQIQERGNSEHLTHAQQMAMNFPGIMAGWIQFLINKNLDRSELLAKANGYRQSFQAHHGRTAETVAFMQVVWELVSEFLDLKELDNEFKQALEAVCLDMYIATTDEMAATVFVETLKGLIEDGTLKLQCLSDDQWGENQNIVGFYNAENVFIFPDKAISEVNLRLQRMNHTEIEFSRNALYRQLSAEKFIVASKKSSTVKFRVGGRSLRMLRFPKNIFSETISSLTSGILRDEMEPQGNGGVEN